MSKNRFGEAASRRRVAPGGEPPVVEVTEEVVVEEPPKPEPVVSAVNPVEGMIEPKQTGKPCGFYLSATAIENLEKLAKQNKCSKSKALDALLKNL